MDTFGFESVWINIKDKYTSLVKIRLLWFTWATSGVKSPQYVRLCLVAAQRGAGGGSSGGGARAGV